jgi:hypothetical protein
LWRVWGSICTPTLQKEHSAGQRRRLAQTEVREAV